MDALVVRNGEVVNRIVLADGEDPGYRVISNGRRQPRLRKPPMTPEIVTDSSKLDPARVKDYDGYWKATRDTRPARDR